MQIPKLAPIESKKQSLQEWHAAGGGVPLQYKGREHVWHAKVKQFAAGGEAHMGAGGVLKKMIKSATVVFPESNPMYGRQPIKFPDVYAKGGAVHMAGGGDPLDEFSPPRYRSAGRRPESQNDRRAAANMPMDFARGVASGVLGAPGDIESLIRMLPGLDERTVLPTSEDIEKRIPLRSDTPAGRAAAGLGTLAGGFYMGPGAPIRLVGGLPQAVYKAGKDFGRAAGQPAANVVKPAGGNFLTGLTENDLKFLKARGPTHRDEALLMGGRYAQEADTPEGIRSMAQDAAYNKWVDSNLTNYVKKQMGTPDDPVRKLAEEGITHKPGLLEEETIFNWNPHLKQKRVKAGFSKEGMGQSPTAQAWERASDKAITTHRAGDIQDMPEQYAKFQEAEQKIRSARQAVERKFRQQMANVGIEEQNMGMHFATSLDEKAKIVGDTDLAKANAEYKSLQSPMMESYIRLGKDNPWISKVNPETPVYTSFTSDLGFDHIMDVLREDLTAGRIRPEQMNKISMSDAVRRTYQYDQELAAKMNASRAAAREGLPTYREYPEGYKWIQLNKPGAFAQESEAMGHSVRGYEPPKGHPDWTEGSGDSGSLGYGHGGWEAIKSGKAKVYSLVDPKGAPHATVEVGQHNPNLDSRYAKENLPELYAKYSANRNDYFNSWPDFLKKEAPELLESTKNKITQIKGKQNRAPSDEYLPYIQDFVKGGKWSDVGDIQNTGMRATSLVFSDAELRMLLERGETDIPHILSGEDIQRLHNTIMPEGKRLKYDAKGNIIGSDEGMAKGGAVHMGKGGKAGALVSVAEAMAAASKKADEILAANKAALEASSPENYSRKVLGSTAAKFANKIADANPKFTAEEVAKKAMNQATKKLDWERTQKPELEKKYGPLSRASYAKSNPIKQRNTPAVVEERMRKANEFLDQPTEAWTPPKSELQAFDRSSIKDALEGFPGVEQSKFPRDIPSRANIEHVEGLYTDPANRALIEKQIMRGLPLGGESFYASLYPVKQAVLEAGMPAEKFDQWIHGLAPASARNSIMNEMAAGQFLRNMNARGIPLTEENVAREMALYKEKFGMGLPLMPLHREGVQKVLEGGLNLRDQNLANIPTNYKIPTYGSQKAGDFANSVVLDVHEAGGQTQGSQFHPYFNEQGGFGNTEYNAGEQGMLGIAKDLGIPGGMAQAGRWFGGGELTGLKSPRGDALDLLEKQVAYTLQQKGIQPNPANVRAEVLRQIETGEGDLLPWYRKEGMPDVRQTGLQRAEGGEVHKAEGGLIREQRFDGGGIAAADFAGPEDDGGSLDKAKLMSKILAEEAKKQGSKEFGSLSKPRAATDLLNRGVIANNPLSAIVDMVNMGLIPLDILGSKLTGRDIKVSSDKPFLGSEHVKDLMNKYNITSGEERPMMETALSFASPTGMIKGAQKTAELAKRAPEALSSVRGGLETMSADAQRPFRSATLTMEGVAPDLGQKGGDKFKDLVTKRMISGEGAPVGMERMGGRKTEKTMGQGLYENFAGQQETNPMVGVTIPRAGNLSTNKQLIADIGTAGRELGQEMVAAHKFTPLMFKNPKDATAMMIGGSERLTKDQIQNIADALPGMIVTHSPKNNSMFVAPFEGDALDYKKASQAASEILGKGAKVQFGKADSNKDIMFRGDYDKMGARPPSAESTEMRNRLKKAEERIVRGPSVSQSGRQSQPSTLTSTVR